jgi:hypothetical protein
LLYAIITSRYFHGKIPALNNSSYKIDVFISFYPQ